MEQIRLVLRKRVTSVLKPLILRELVNDVWKLKYFMILLFFPAVIFSIEILGPAKDLGSSTSVDDMICSHQDTFQYIKVGSLLD